VLFGIKEEGRDLSQIGSQLAPKVREIKIRRGLTYSQIAVECGGCEKGFTGERISGLVHCHSLRSDLLPAMIEWLERNSE
jgi:hypothetical protein